MKLIFLILIIFILILLTGIWFVRKNKEYFTSDLLSGDKNYIFNLDACNMDSNDLYSECNNKDYYILRGVSTSDYIKISESNEENAEECKNKCKESEDVNCNFAQFIYNKNTGNDTNTNVLSNNYVNCYCLKAGYEYLPTLLDENISQESALIGLTPYYELNDNIELYIQSTTGEYLYFDKGILQMKSFDKNDKKDPFIFKIQKSKSYGFKSYYKILPKYINGTENFSSVVYFTGSKLNTCFDSDSQKEIVLTENSNQVMVGNPGDYFNECHMLYIYNQYKDTNNFIKNYIKERILGCMVKIYVKNNYTAVFSSRLDYIANVGSYNKDLNRFKFDISSYGIKVTDIDYIHIYRDSADTDPTVQTFYDKMGFSVQNLEDYKLFYINLTQVELLNRSGVNVLSYANVNPSSILNDEIIPENLIDSNITTIFSTDSTANTGSLPSIKINFEDITFSHNSFFYIHPSIYKKQATKNMFCIVNVLSNYYLSTLKIIENNTTNTKNNVVTFTKPVRDLQNDCNNSGKDIGFKFYSTKETPNGSAPSDKNPYDSDITNCDNSDNAASYSDLFNGIENEYVGKLIYLGITDTEYDASTNNNSRNEGDGDFIAFYNYRGNLVDPDTSGTTNTTFPAIDCTGTGTSTKCDSCDKQFFCKLNYDGQVITESKHSVYLEGLSQYYDQGTCVSGDGTGFIDDTHSCAYINIHFYYDNRVSGWKIYTYANKNKKKYYLGFNTNPCKPYSEITPGENTLDIPTTTISKWYGILVWATEDEWANQTAWDDNSSTITATAGSVQNISTSQIRWTWTDFSLVKSDLNTDDYVLSFKWYHPKMWTGYGDDMTENYYFELKLATYDIPIKFNNINSQLIKNRTKCSGSTPN